MDTAVGLVQAYLHLNGYLVLTEVPVQLESGGAFYTETDLDILAVRFPHEPEAHPSRSSTWEEFYRGADPVLDLETDSIDFIVGEVKEGRSHANPALRRQATLHFALHRIGCCPEGDVIRISPPRWPARARPISRCAAAARPACAWWCSAGAVTCTTRV